MKNKYVFFLLIPCLFFGGICKASISRLDSLNEVFRTAKNDTVRVAALLNMANVLYLQNTDSAKKLWLKADQIIDKALHRDSLSPISKFYTQRLVFFKSGTTGGLGYIYFITGNPDKGLEYTQISINYLKLFGGFTKELGLAYNNIGYMNTERGDLYTAIHYYDSGLVIQKQLKDTDGFSNVINNLGYSYQLLQDSSKAMQYYREALQLRMEIHDTSGMSTTLNNIATVKSKAGDIDGAIKFYEKSLVCSKRAKNKDEIALITDNLASCFEKKNELDTAYIYASRSLKSFAELGDKEGMAYAMGYIGVVYTQKNKLDSAQKYLGKAMVIANQLKYKSLIVQTALELSKLYKQMGDYKNAYNFYVIYKENTDSINNKQAQKEAIRNQLKYEYQKREIQQQERLKQEELKHKEELKRQHIIIGGVSVGILFLVIFIFTLVSRLRIIRKQNEVIEGQKITVEEKNKEMTESIQYASQIQQTILPEATEFKNLFPESFVFWKPKDIVSGDFYWISNHKGNRYILAADCTGHGVPGALMSMVGADLFNETVNRKGFTRPAEIFDEIRTGIISVLRQKGNSGEQKDGMDASLCAFGKQEADGSFPMSFAGANNPIWIIKKEENDVNCLIEIPSDKQPIGIHGDKLLPFTEKNISLQKGDTVYLFSDGYADQFGGEKGKKFKYSQLRNLLVSFRNKSLDEQYKILQNKFTEWKGNLEQIDDVLIIGIRL